MFRSFPLLDTALLCGVCRRHGGYEVDNGEGAGETTHRITTVILGGVDILMRNRLLLISRGASHDDKWTNQESLSEVDMGHHLDQRVTGTA